MDEELDNLLDYLQKAGLNTINTNSPAWKLLGMPNQGLLSLSKNLQHNPNKKSKTKTIDKTMNKTTKKIIDKTIEHKNGQKMTVGNLVRHRTVPALGLGLVVAESNQHKGFWMIQWCDPRYYDVGNLGIDENYLEIV